MRIKQAIIVAALAAFLCAAAALSQDKGKGAITNIIAINSTSPASIPITARFTGVKAATTWPAWLTSPLESLFIGRDSQGVRGV
jgi:ABC-type transport system involved in cytochrome c biogenesis permease component